MDGNGRWARARHLPRTEGHRRGVNAAREVIADCLEHGIGVLTLFAFSSENWRRPAVEVNTLMDLFLAALRREWDKLHAKGVRITFIGDRSAFNEKLRSEMENAERHTEANRMMTLVIAANYGGRWDIEQAARQYAGACLKAGKVLSSESGISLQEFLSTHELPDPDLFIRTGGEKRLSNFLLWQMAYTELYFSEELWPDFGSKSLRAALEDYAKRQRRFGRTDEQIQAADNG